MPRNQSQRVMAMKPLEAREIRCGLSRTEFVHRGTRAHFYVLSAGRAEIIWEFEAREICAPAIIWLPIEDDASLFAEAGAHGRVLSFPPRHLELERTLGEDWGALDLDRRILLQDTPRSLINRLDAIILTVRSELEHRQIGGDIIIQSCIKQLCVELLRVSNSAEAGDQVRIDTLARRFMRLVDLHLADNWRLAKYAAELEVSKDKLVAAMRGATGKSPIEYVHARLLSEAKTLLRHSDLPVAHIASALGFCDSAYFNRFFRTRVGAAPSKFRKERRAETGALEETFHAWP